jgi:hypothetical protein
MIVYFGIALAYVLVTGVGAGVGWGVGAFGDADFQASSVAWGGIVGFGLTAGAIYFLREYILYIVKAGHIAVLVSEGIGGTECHFLAALADGMPGAEFGRVHHRPRAELEAIEQRLRDRGLVDSSGRFTPTGRETKNRIEALTDELAQPPYDALTDAELRELATGLGLITSRLTAGISPRR